MVTDLRRVTIRFEDNVSKLVEQWRKLQTPIPSFNQAINTIVKDHLGANGYLMDNHIRLNPVKNWLTCRICGINPTTPNSDICPICASKQVEVKT